MLVNAIRMTGLAGLAGLALYAGYDVVSGKKTAPTQAPVLMAGLSELAEETDAMGRQIRGLPERQETGQTDDTQMTANPVKADKPDDGKFFSTNPKRADKVDDGKFFTTNPRHADKKDDGKFFTTNPKLVAKKDDGDFFTTSATGGEFDPCVKADGTPYQGPGTALNPFAPVSPCLPKATAESYAEIILEPQPEPEIIPTRTTLPSHPDYFAPEPALPPFSGGSDYKVI